MSQNNPISQALPNGLPAHLNGVDSSHSSRDSSPSTKMYQQIPSTQLPPLRNIPSSQLPPKMLNQLSQNYEKMQINPTPTSSPSMRQFGTSTPTSEADKPFKEVPLRSGNFNQDSALSPIPVNTGFTHSSTSHFSNVQQSNQVNINNPMRKTPEILPRPQNVLGRNPTQPTSQNMPPQNVPLNLQNRPSFNGGSSMSQQQQMPQRPPLQSALTQPKLQNFEGHGHTSAVKNVLNNRPNLFNKVLESPMDNKVNQQIIPPSINNNATTNKLENLHDSKSGNNFQNQQGTNQANGILPNYSNQPNIPTINQYYNPVQKNPVEQNINQGVVQNPGMQSMVRPTMPNTQSGFQGAPMNTNVTQSFRPPNQPPLPQPNAYQNHPQMPPRPTDKTTTPPLINQQQSTGFNQTRTNLHANRYPTQPMAQQFNQQPMAQQFNQQPMAQQFNQQPMEQQYNQQSMYQQPSINQHKPPMSQQQPLVNQRPVQNVPPITNQQRPTQQNYQNFQANAVKQNQSFPQQNQYSSPQTGFSKLWGGDNFDLLQCPNILPQEKVNVPRVNLGNELLDAANCHPDIFRCTMTKIPETNSLLQKSRLPLGVLIHPFRDLNHLPVIQCNTIVRCRSCRTYINPFVFFVDNKRWKCNLCYRVNELPEEFQYDPVTKTYGDPSRRPEVRTSTIEYIAPAEYMLRPPQPALYLFLLDISRHAIESGYLHSVCNVLSAELKNLPGDARTQIGFIAYDSALHFFSLADGLSQPHEMTVLDIDDMFLPCPDNLMVNLQDRMELVVDLLTQLPNRYNHSYDTGSALGAALQAAHKMMASTGGRVTVFQASLPGIGPGALTSREDPSQRAGTDVPHLSPANDFYKRLALDCSGQQIAVDLFLINSQYIDLGTISGISKFSGGSIYHFPLFKASRSLQNQGFEKNLRRYLTRKIGFEAVMRIRCTRGLAIHTFHGNFFVRSTDLLSLPNVNPDAGFGMQVAIEESLSDVQTVCFQAALLYTSSKGERRIRVHTLCLPVVANLTEVIHAADQQCIIGLLAKMAVDRSLQSSLSDARDAFINVAIDILSSYKLSQNLGSASSSLLAPNCLRLLPLYISALLKNTAFRVGISTRLDDRVKAMCDMKTKPLPYLMQQIYPDLYPIHDLENCNTILNDEKEPVHMPPHLQLSARCIDSNGAYLMDMGEHMIIMVCSAVSELFITQVLGLSSYSEISDQMYELPLLDNDYNQKLHMFINYLNEEKPMNATLQIIKDNSAVRATILERLIEDRVENALSYHEFLQHLKSQVK